MEKSARIREWDWVMIKKACTDDVYTKPKYYSLGRGCLIKENQQKIIKTYQDEFTSQNLSMFRWISLFV